MEAEPFWLHAGEFVVSCPSCEAEVAMAVRCRLVADQLGNQFVQTDIQTDDLWAHAWTHKAGEPGD